MTKRVPWITNKWILLSNGLTPKIVNSWVSGCVARISPLSWTSLDYLDCIQGGFIAESNLFQSARIQIKRTWHHYKRTSILDSVPFIFKTSWIVFVMEIIILDDSMWNVLPFFMNSTSLIPWEMLEKSNWILRHFLLKIPVGPRSISLINVQ